MKHISQEHLVALTHLLKKEKADLESELAEHGKRVGGDWQGTPSGFEESEADETDGADRMEELAINVPLVEELEARLKEVVAALERIDNGTYGIDEESGKPILVERLHANPAARTNI